MHNALESHMPNEPVDPNTHFLAVQYKVFKELIANESVSDKRTFIIANAHLFRHFATHLPDDLRESWVDADLNDLSRIKLANQYEIFHTEIDTFIEQLEPEIKLALDEAINSGDTDLTTYILESTFERKHTK